MTGVLHHSPLAPRVCIIYDCRYPLTHGGAEKWLGSLARSLAGSGANVTYLHAAGRAEVREDEVEWIGLCDASDPYTAAGVRRGWPAVRFSCQVARYLRAHHGDFDLVYVHDMPILPVLAAWWGLKRANTPWLVEWIEWWSARYWRSYAGPVAGTVGYLAQRLALRKTPVAVCYSDLTTAALRRIRPRARVVRLAGQADCGSEGSVGRVAAERRALPPDPPLAAFLGRFVPHKRAELAMDAVLAARQAIPNLRMVVMGSGPGEVRLRQRAATDGRGWCEVLAGAGDGVVREVLGRASVLVHPSAREGFGLVVPEANSLGVPVVLVEGPDNAAVELVRKGGGVAIATADPDELGRAIVAVIRAGEAARREALANAERLCRDRSVAASSRELLRMLPRLGRER